MELTVINKLKQWNKLQQMDTLCRRLAHCRLEDSVAVVQNASVAAHDTIHDTLARDRGRRRLFEHMRNQREQVETLWESGKTIRHVTQKEGQGT